MAVWIRLLELPIEFYEPSALLKIGQAIGPILRIDSHIASNVRGRFTRLCVQVKLDKPLINTIQIGKMVQIQREEAPNPKASLSNRLVILPRQFRTYPLEILIFPLDPIIILLIPTPHALRSTGQFFIRTS